MRQLPIIALALLLTACTAPTTQRPTYSQAELKAEQDMEAKAAQQAKAGKFDDKRDYDEAALTKLQTRLEPLAARISKSAQDVCHDLAKTACDFAVIVDPKEKGLNAHADGQKVVVYPAMIDFAKNDNQLAFVIAHEFAHSIMGHVASQKQNVLLGSALGMVLDVAAASQGINTQGAASKMGGQTALLRYSSEFEAEADYVGLYILARAGYNIHDAPTFWRLMSIQTPDAVYATSTHPTNPARVLAMNNTVAEIERKRAAHQPLLPNIKPQQQD